MKIKHLASIAILASSILIFNSACTSSDRAKAIEDSIARADSLAHIYDAGDSLLRTATALAEKIAAADNNSNWEELATEVGQLIINRDKCDKENSLSSESFRKINELIGNISGKVETLPASKQEVYQNALTPLLEKSASIDGEQVTEEIVE